MTLADNPRAIADTHPLTKVSIRSLDGSPWIDGWLSDPAGRRWSWIADRICEELGCDYADVDILEDENLGDILTVKGKPVGLLP